MAKKKGSRDFKVTLPTVGESDRVALTKLGFTVSTEHGALRIKVPTGWRAKYNGRSKNWRCFETAGRGEVFIGSTGGIQIL